MKVNDTLNKLERMSLELRSSERKDRLQGHRKNLREGFQLEKEIEDEMDSRRLGEMSEKERVEVLMQEREAER